MATCPNINLPQWKELVASRGENMAYFLWDTYNGEVPQSESKQAILRASIKSIDILSSQKAKQMFAKGEKNNWTLDKTLTELQVPKAQKEIILDKGITDREEIITSLLAENSFIVEVNISNERTDTLFTFKDFNYNGDEITTNHKNTYREYFKNGKQISKEEWGNIVKLYRENKPTQYYSNLTVPGGTNYTENEITTPDITPNIKGHAQFSTDNGIGWFRSDDKIKIISVKKSYEEFKRELQRQYPNIREEVIKNSFQSHQGTVVKEKDSKTRRILEVQSDLFQKGRDKELLINPLSSKKLKREGADIGDKFIYKGEEIEVIDYTLEYYELKNLDTNKISRVGQKELESYYDYTDSKTSQNQFLQLLNKKNNWVTFFVKSIIQDSAKKGYERVLFPKGSTASKIEGLQTLEEFRKQKESRIKILEQEIKDLDKGIFGSFKYVKEDNKFYIGEINDPFGVLKPISENEYKTDLKRGLTLKENELKTLKQELADVESGKNQLSSISNFYENNITNILKKNGYNPVEIKDEYNNTWNEVLIAPAQANETILFQKQTEQPITKASSEMLNKVKEVIKKMGVNVQPLTDYARQNPAIDESSVNAVADLTAGVIAIAEGKEDVALTEEMVHIATAIIEQKNPELVTEMISKIGRFKIYKDTLEAYKDLPAYQLENGKPNIRKIKKEAVDKMITSIILGDTSLEEADQSIFRRMWDMITDWFRGQYKKANIDIFSTTAETVIGGEFEGSVVDLDSKEIYYQLTDKQKDFQRKVEETRASLRKIETNEKADPLLLDEEKATSYYELLINGKYERITKRVTDRVKAWYRSRFGNTGFTAQQDKDNEVKRVLGTQYHEYFEETHARFFNEDGTRRENPGPRPNIQGSLNNDVYNKLETYYTDLIASFSENGKNPLVFSELQVYDSKNKEAGTIDLLIVEQDGTANIYDWKFMSVAKGCRRCCLV